MDPSEAAHRRAARTADGSAASGAVSAPQAIVTTPLGAAFDGAVAVALGRTASAVARLLPGRRRRLAWRQFGNKLAGYEAFRRAPAAPVGGRARAPRERTGDAAEAAAANALWAIEGAAHTHARLFAGIAPTGWLGAAVAAAPPSVLAPLLCGFGVALAERRLAPLAGAREGGGAVVPEADHAVDRTLDSAIDVAADLAVWRAVLPPGAAEVLVEAEGFVARLRYRRSLIPLADRWRQVGDEAYACFWHGAGRATYLDPRHLAPWAAAPWRLAAAERPPDPLALANLWAGLAFAVTLVNLSDPAVLDELVADLAADPAAATALVHGVGSAIEVCRQAAPGHPYLASWCRFHGERPEGELARLWRRHAAGSPGQGSPPSVETVAAGPAGLFRFLPPE